MRLARFYFCEHEAETCRPLKSIREWMLQEGIERRTVYPARIMYNTDYYYCTEYQEIGEVGQDCGKICKKYEPRNGKNGRCRYSNNGYEPDFKNPLIITVVDSTYLQDKNR
jgi:hypothetical protein